MNNPTANREAFYLALMSIPAGKVITYGQLAALAGLPGAARLAGTVLCGLPEQTDLPWHRVINAQGKISLPENSSAYQEQKKRLEAEGVTFTNNKINLRIYGYTTLTPN
ncbi:MGMT family protein [Cellvibrio sp. OA-2007]|uniref:MGMT family protein n=1 Tax=Cellvibrio sp. OA-2007 TaxID=529823 RepID=UPI0007853E6B|nr:MGMT family protein [Cellvibrio sp. OA-2007]